MAPDHRVLLVGFGGYGPTHAQAWRSIGLGTTLIVADPDPAARAKALAAGFDAGNIVEDYRTCLDAVDIVDAVVPLPVHMMVAEAALGAGKHLLLEKPATANAGDAARLAAMTAQSGQVVQIGYPMRFHPLAIALKDLLASGVLGDPVYLAGESSGFKRLRADIGVLRNDAVHLLDLTRWLLGQTPNQVFAVLQDDLGRGVESLACVVLRYADGVVARIEAGRTGIGHNRDPIVPGAVTTQLFCVVGSKGAAEINFHTGRLTHRRARYRDDGQMSTPEMQEAIVTEDICCSWTDVTARALRAFIDSVDTDGRSRVPVGEAGVDMAILCEAIEASAQTCTTIDLEAKR
ncbi:MAG: Gfo/Idh/MocA family protein [Alphaproteobacteria bacterium]